MTINTLELENVIAKQHEQSPFSGVIWIKEQGNVIFAKSYGFANRSEAILNALDTRFANASGTKTFTSVAICQLVEKNLLTFDTLLKDCLDIPFPNFDPQVSVHHLLTHSSGVPDYYDEAIMDDHDDVWKVWPMYNMRTLRDFLPMFQHREMAFTPGEKFAYNNAGYILLGLIIEQVSKLRFCEYVEANIFTRCDMADSGFFSMDALPPRTAYGYTPINEHEWRTNFYEVPIVGGSDGGAFVTVGDMEKFWMALMDRKLISDAMLGQMLAPHISTQEQESHYGYDFGSDRHYGYGIWIEQKEDAQYYHMLGGDPGVGFYSGLYTAQNIQVTLMGNVVDPFYEMEDCVKSFIITPK